MFAPHVLQLTLKPPRSPRTSFQWLHVASHLIGGSTDLAIPTAFT
jgi:hypothetical protein